MTLYTNGETVWTYEQMRDEVFPAEIKGVDMDQFIGGELSFEDWLAEGLGFYPASLAPADIARYREQIAERKARVEAGERDGWGPGGYKWRQWNHLKEEKRRAEVEARGRADVADLYEDL